MITIQLAQERKAFLDEMVAFYSARPASRAIKRDYNGAILGCFYRTDDGRKCAIGRYISDDKYTIAMESSLSSEMDLAFQALEPKVQVLGVGFLAAVQDLHDSDCYWGSNGLNGFGQCSYDRILHIYCTPTREEIGDPPAYIEEFIKHTGDVIQHQTLENC